jgi:hypothetical protein
MKRIALSVVLLAAPVIAAAAESVSGTVVDVMCRTKDLAGHTRQCAVTCAKSGFGVVTADGKFLKFDEAGNTKALAALKTLSREKDLKAKVTGTVDGDLIKVDAIDFQQ